MSPRPRPPGTILRTVSRRMSAADMQDDDTLAAARLGLLEDLNRWADLCGYTRSETRETVSHDTLTLTGMMSPRTDGQWPSIHAAIAEDREEMRLLRNPGDPF